MVAESQSLCENETLFVQTNLIGSIDARNLCYMGFAGVVKQFISRRGRRKKPPGPEKS